MCRYVGLLLVGGCIALIAAVSVAAAPKPGNNDAATVKPPATPTVAVQQVTVPFPGMRDEAAMVLVGTALIGLGAAVRRAA